MRNGIVLRIENTSRISYDAPLNTYSERPPASRHVLHVFVSAKSAHVGTSVRVHPPLAAYGDSTFYEVAFSERC